MAGGVGGTVGGDVRAPLSVVESGVGSPNNNMGGGVKSHGIGIGSANPWLVKTNNSQNLASPWVWSHLGVPPLGQRDAALWGPSLGSVVAAPGRDSSLIT